MLHVNHSTNHAVILLVEKVAKALDTGKIVIGVYLDIKRHLMLFHILFY